MKFEGNLSKFFPPDLLMFLANLGKEGLLTITCDQEFQTISFKDGLIIGAHSSLADEKLLLALYMHKFITGKQYNYISQARKETGIQVIPILEKMDLFSLDRIQSLIEKGIKEVIFRFFLLKSGQFKFSTILVDQPEFNKPLSPMAVAMDISSWTDEWQEIERSVTSFERTLAVTDSGKKPEKPGQDERLILSLVRGNKTINQIVAFAPIPSFAALKAIERALGKGWLKMSAPVKKTALKNQISEEEALFLDYKKTVKQILAASDTNGKIKNLIGFCKDHFAQTYIISASEDKLLRCVVFFKDEKGNNKRRDIRNVDHNIDDDPIFSRVFRSGFAFFGNMFETSITKGIVGLPADGDCAVIPLGKKANRGNFIYAVSTKASATLSSFHYLELLSWLINPDAENAQWSGTSSAEAESAEAAPVSDVRPSTGLQNLAEVIDELPPMPHLATRILQILSAPDSSISDLVEVMAQDPSLMATLIKVSNSVLYSSGNPISTLNDAVARLGLKTIRSIVLTSTTHAMFPVNKAKFGVLNHALWQHSKECGMASRRVAETIKYDDPEEAFSGGLLHDIGKLAILLKFTDEYSRIQKKQASDKISSTLAEKELIGFDHTDIGVLLMEKWNMPDNLIACVKNHHQPEEQNEFSTLANIISLGDYLSHLHGTQSDAHMENRPPEIHRIMQTLNISEDQEKSLNENIISDFTQSDIFD